MVKRTLFALAAALAATAGWGLSARESTVLAPAIMAFPGVRPAQFASLLRRNASVTVVYADRDTTSLRVVDVPVAGALPTEAPKAVFVDKVDIVPPLGGSFGLHASAVIDGRLRLLYLDREKEDRQLLKRITEDTGGWRLELVEPFGLPVAVLAGVDGKPVDVWAAGSLLLRGAAVDQVLREPCVPHGQAVLLDPERETGPAGFGVWDDASGELVIVLTGPEGAQSYTVPGASPVYALAEAPGRGLAVATWVPGSRRILLLERDPEGGLFHQTTVTVCDGTNGLFLSWTPSGWLFVYDEIKPAPLGRWVWELCMLSPESRAVGRPRYRRSVLSSNSRQLAGFRALRDGESLFVLEMRDGLQLLKIPLD
ncbi:MAG: hypothetical protein NTU62_09385 [Spirochaetes bacterium]|nr:hypothetical protein [Spirochaetota bacterium]